MWFTIFKFSAAVIGGLIGGIMYYFCVDKLPLKQALEQLKNWLLLAVTDAEALFGAKLGVLKFEYVYDKFREKFPKLAKKISYEQFSEFVDEALEKMRHYIETNDKFKEYINKEEK